MWTIFLKVFIKSVTILLLVYVSFFWVEPHYKHFERGIGVPI